jgi:uncharacterized Ntn-hydrolase superfamily protein
VLRTIALVSLLLWSARAEATYSILGVDQETDEVGGAGTSCVGTLDVSIIYGSVPGVGVVHAQAYINQAGRDRAVELLGMGDVPANIISDITSPFFDPDAPRRQYAVATIDGAIANYTGGDNGTYAGHDTGYVDRFAFSVQGNILTSANVVTNAKAGFESGGCDLAERLMLALEAGAQNGEGDSRCTGNGIPSDSAFIRVDRKDDARWLYLHIEDTSPVSPLIMLREQFDDWRLTHGCTEVPVPDAGVIDLGTPDAGPEPEDASQPADATMMVMEDEGCGCTTTSRSSASPLLLLAMLALARGSSRCSRDSRRSRGGTADRRSSRP